MVVSIQGVEGSFHQAAAIKFFGKKVKVHCCNTFENLVQTVRNGEVDAGIMAIENSLAGSLLPNYKMILESDLQITGENYLHISQNLLVNKNVELEDIKEVHSHYMAILQSIDFLNQYHWKMVETEDTALSAKHIHQYKSKHIAGIGSKLAAELYELKVLAADIQTNKKNYTRFLIVEKRTDSLVIPNANKASIHFHADHKKGSLAKLLTVIAKHDINLSKLQSIPIPGSKFNYSFHADLEFEENIYFVNAMYKIKFMITNLTILGVYQRGKLP